MKLFKRASTSIIAILLLSILLAACGGSGTAVNAAKDKDSLQRVKDTGKLTVVGSGGYPPFNFFDDNGKVVGFDVDVGQAIAERMGVELNYVTSDWDGLVEGLRNKRYDGILGSMAITEDRLKVVAFSDPYYYSGAQLVVRSDSGITDSTQMKGKTIGVTTGTNYVDDAKELGAEVSLYQDDNATLMELINGRIDGIITDRLVALKAMEEMSGGSDLVLAGKILRLEEMGIAINKDDTTLLAAVNEILEEMREDGTLSEISNKWHNGVDITVE